MDAVIKQAVREELRRNLNDPNPPTAQVLSMVITILQTLDLIMEDKDAC